MFSEVLASIRNNRLPEMEPLRKRFDFALTKKVGVLQLPPSFWMLDPKINPRADHLFWAALLLMDRERIETALSILTTESQEKKHGRFRNNKGCHHSEVKMLVDELLSQFSSEELKEQFIGDLRRIVPELL